MATIQRFEDLDVWKKARVLAQQVFEMTAKDPMAKDYKLKDQMLRSSGSVMDNIAEGFERGGRAEFINFLTIAKGSAAECRSQLYQALDRNYIQQDRFKELYDLADEVGRMINGLITYLNKTTIRGTKFKDRV